MKKNYKNSGLKSNKKETELKLSNILSVSEMIAVRGGGFPPILLK